MNNHPNVANIFVPVFKIALDYSVNSATDYNINASFKLILNDDRAKIDSPNEMNTELRTNSPPRNIRIINISPQKPNFGVQDDIFEDNPLTVQAEVKFNLKHDNCPALGCPMLDPRSTGLTQNAVLDINFQSGCAIENQCQCDLKLNQKHVMPTLPPYIVGSSETLTLKLNISNDGHEPAFKATIIITSKDVKLPMITGRKDCKDVNSTIGKTYRCQLRPFPKLSKRTETFSFELDNHVHFELDFKGFNISVGLERSCKGKMTVEELEKGVFQELLFQSDLKTETFIRSKGQNSAWHTVNKGEDILYNEEDITLQHVYEIINQGPSPSTENTTFDFYIPQDSLLTNIKIDGGASCKDKGVTGMFKTNAPESRYSNPICCSNRKCKSYQCQIPNNWLKNDKKIFTIEMKFQSSEALKQEHKFDNFAIFSHLRIKGDEAMIHSISEMTTVRIGAAQVVVQYLPIVISTILALIFLLGLLYFLHKNGCLNKLRFYNNQLEQEKEVVEKRKSMAIGKPVEF